MPYLRFKALEEVQNRTKVRVESESSKVSDYFGENSFDLNKMQQMLVPLIFKKVKNSIEKGKKIDKESADAVATAAKTWAMAKGITHYTHWFQPLTGATAEKHDSFFDASVGIEHLKGVTLVQQESDASSFPNGGIRSTFEARGYTAWDPSSPIFILGRTLCIPTIFVSYTGEALDNKAPLLKTVVAIDIAAQRVCQYFDKKVTKVTPFLGCEQEYFVIDKSLHDARPDLVMSGRTVFGHSPARGQQLDDHYFGSIPSRVYDFMKDFEIEALKLGIPVMTRHNEVAPSQFEVAPLFEEINIATDHNQLMMDVMQRISIKHKLKILFHEKPFAGLNGNGKHNNWSLITNTGVNLFQPSSSAKENLQFLTFFVCTIKAVHDYAELLRASIASSGNDYRLGANEAPPAIISIFIGTQLSSILDDLENNGNIKVEKGDNIYMKLGIDKIPAIILDNTDRNRTSPFAFTGNKFEFRAVGADTNVASPMAVLNLIVADVLTEFAEKVDNLIEKGKDKRLAIVNILRTYIKESKNIRFDGDGYSKQWEKEAKERGLPNIKNTPQSLKAYLSKKSVDVYSKFNVLSKFELKARSDIKYENYTKKIQIEARSMSDLTMNHIIPTAIKYQNRLISNAKGLKSIEIDNAYIKPSILLISELIKCLIVDSEEMIKERKRVNKITNSAEKAVAYCDDIKEKYFSKIRKSVDKLELIIDDEDWPLPKYRELLFIR